MILTLEVGAAACSVASCCWQSAGRPSCCWACGVVGVGLLAAVAVDGVAVLVVAVAAVVVVVSDRDDPGYHLPPHRW